MQRRPKAGPAGRRVGGGAGVAGVRGGDGSDSSSDSESGGSEAVGLRGGRRHAAAAAAAAEEELGAYLETQLFKPAEVHRLRRGSGGGAGAAGSASPTSGLPALGPRPGANAAAAAGDKATAGSAAGGGGFGGVSYGDDPAQGRGPLRGLQHQTSPIPGIAGASAAFGSALRRPSQRLDMLLAGAGAGSTLRSGHAPAVGRAAQGRPAAHHPDRLASAFLDAVMLPDEPARGTRAGQHAATPAAAAAGPGQRGSNAADVSAMLDAAAEALVKGTSPGGGRMSLRLQSLWQLDSEVPVEAPPAPARPLPAAASAQRLVPPSIYVLVEGDEAAGGEEEGPAAALASAGPAAGVNRSYTAIDMAAAAVGASAPAAAHRPAWGASTAGSHGAAAGGRTRAAGDAVVSVGGAGLVISRPQSTETGPDSAAATEGAARVLAGSPPEAGGRGGGEVVYEELLESAAQAILSDLLLENAATASSDDSSEGAPLPPAAAAALGAGGSSRPARAFIQPFALTPAAGSGPTRRSTRGGLQIGSLRLNSVRGSGTGRPLPQAPPPDALPQPAMPGLAQPFDAANEATRVGVRRLHHIPGDGTAAAPEADGAVAGAAATADRTPGRPGGQLGRQAGAHPFGAPSPVTSAPPSVFSSPATAAREGAAEPGLSLGLFRNPMAPQPVTSGGRAGALQGLAPPPQLHAIGQQRGGLLDLGGAADASAGLAAAPFGRRASGVGATLSAAAAAVASSPEASFGVPPPRQRNGSVAGLPLDAFHAMGIAEGPAEPELEHALPFGVYEGGDPSERSSGLYSGRDAGSGSGAAVAGRRGFGVGAGRPGSTLAGAAGVAMVGPGGFRVAHNAMQAVGLSDGAADARFSQQNGPLGGDRRPSGAAAFPSDTLGLAGARRGSYAAAYDAAEQPPVVAGRRASGVAFPHADGGGRDLLFDSGATGRRGSFVDPLPAVIGSGRRGGGVSVVGGADGGPGMGGRRGSGAALSSLAALEAETQLESMLALTHGIGGGGRDASPAAAGRRRPSGVADPAHGGSGYY
jgi:hypothetical protein